jgi:protein gp37
MRRFIVEGNGWRTDIPNLWLGVTAENQARANERIPILLQTPAARRFVSMEPMLERVNLISIPGDWLGAAEKYDALRGQSWYLTGGHIGISGGPKLDWVIAGPETGPGARPCDPDWIHQTIRECRDSGVPCFIKARERIGMPDAPQEWPDALEEKPCCNWLAFDDARNARKEGRPTHERQ